MLAVVVTDEAFELEMAAAEDRIVAREALDRLRRFRRARGPQISARWLAHEQRAEADARVALLRIADRVRDRDTT
jgi:hypothetical protein